MRWKNWKINIIQCLKFVINFFAVSGHDFHDTTLVGICDARC